MNFIYKDFVKQNIHNLTTNHIRLFALKNSIDLTDQEIKIIYDFIQKNYQALLNKDTSCFKELQSKLSNHLYQQILKLYETYKIYL